MTTVLIITNILLILALIGAVYVLRNVRVSGTDHIVDVNNIVLNVSGKLDNLIKLTEQQDSAILGQNKGVSELTAAFNLNTVNVRNKLESLETAIKGKSFDGIIEIGFSPVLKELEKIKTMIEVKEDSVIHYGVEKK